YPFGITSFGQFLIWTDWDARTIQQYDRQSFILQPAIRSFRGSSGAFYEIKVVQKPKDIDSHECSKNNGGCSSLCLPKPGGRTCACANGYYLVSKEDTLRLRGLGSGLGSGSGIGSVIGSGLNVTMSGSGQGGSGSGGSGIKPKSGPTLTLISSSNNNITSGEAICVDEETYKYLDNLS
ncbi:low-density lipo receptor-related 4, partial [Paramuricea clavata]